MPRISDSTLERNIQSFTGPILNQVNQETPPGLSSATAIANSQNTLRIPESKHHVPDAELLYMLSQLGVVQTHAVLIKRGAAIRESTIESLQRDELAAVFLHFSKYCNTMDNVIRAREAVQREVKPAPDIKIKKPEYLTSTAINGNIRDRLAAEEERERIDLLVELMKAGVDPTRGVLIKDLNDIYLRIVDLPKAVLINYFPSFISDPHRSGEILSREEMLTALNATSPDVAGTRGKLSTDELRRLWLYDMQTEARV